MLVLRMLLEAIRWGHHEAVADVTAASHYSRGGTGGQELENTVRAQVLQIDRPRNLRRLACIRCRRCSRQPGWSCSDSLRRLRPFRRSSPSSAEPLHPADGRAEKGSETSEESRKARTLPIVDVMDRMERTRDDVRERKREREKRLERGARVAQGRPGEDCRRRRERAQNSLARRYKATSQSKAQHRHVGFGKITLSYLNRPDERLAS